CIQKIDPALPEAHVAGAAILRRAALGQFHPPAWTGHTHQLLDDVGPAVARNRGDEEALVDKVEALVAKGQPLEDIANGEDIVTRAYIKPLPKGIRVFGWRHQIEADDTRAREERRHLHRPAPRAAPDIQDIRGLICRSRVVAAQTRPQQEMLEVQPVDLTHILGQRIRHGGEMLAAAKPAESLVGDILEHDIMSLATKRPHQMYSLSLREGKSRLRHNA